MQDETNHQSGAQLVGDVGITCLQRLHRTLCARNRPPHLERQQGITSAKNQSNQHGLFGFWSDPQNCKHTSVDLLDKLRLYNIYNIVTL